MSILICDSLPLFVLWTYAVSMKTEDAKFSSVTWTRYSMQLIVFFVLNLR